MGETTSVKTDITYKMMDVKRVTSSIQWYDNIHHAYLVNQTAAEIENTESSCKSYYGSNDSLYQQFYGI